MRQTMAKEGETPRINPAEIENLIEQIRGTNLEPGAKEKVERLYGIPTHFDAVGVVDQPIEDAVGKRGIADLLLPAERARASELIL